MMQRVEISGHGKRQIQTIVSYIGQGMWQKQVRYYDPPRGWVTSVWASEDKQTTWVYIEDRIIR